MIYIFHENDCYGTLPSFDDNIVKKRIKRLFRKTKEDARRVFVRARRSFVDFVNRW